MGLQINSNAAMMTLGELNKNINKAGKELTKIASGEKLSSAQDGTSEYAISERMRTDIRAILQDNENIQNGSALVNIASGAIGDIVDNLRQLKELAVNAATDTNNDSDRKMLQKTFAKTIEVIDDIAIDTTYNGKHLLDGTYDNGQAYERIVTGSHIENRNEIIGYEYVDIVHNPKQTTEIANADGTITVRHDNSIANEFELTLISTGTTHYTGNVRAANGMTCDEGFRLSNWSWATNYSGGTLSQFTASDYEQNQIAVALTINTSGASVTDGSTVTNKLADFNNDGFSILCGGCNQYINIVFDTNRINKDSNYDIGTNKNQYVIGIKDLGASDSTVTSVQLQDAIFNGIQAAHVNRDVYTGNDVKDGDNVVRTVIDQRHNVGMAINPEWDESDPTSPKYVLLKDTTPAMDFITGGVVIGNKKSDGTITTGDTRSTVVNDPWTETISTPVYREYQEEVEDVHEKPFVDRNPLIIHTGPKANQSVSLLFSNMHTRYLKTAIPSDADMEHLETLKYQPAKYSDYVNVLNVARAKTLDECNIESRMDAKVTMRVVESALEYATNEAARVGAYASRLEFSGANITTMGENMQAAESTIRDLDMAKAMISYTKDNILSQAAQSMLAQANQNQSQVLSLLQ